MSEVSGRGGNGPLDGGWWVTIVFLCVAIAFVVVVHWLATQHAQLAECEHRIAELEALVPAVEDGHGD